MEPLSSHEHSPRPAHFLSGTASARGSGLDLRASRAAVVREVIKRRRSTRRFAEEPVSRQDLLDLVEAGIYAPSGSNWQNQRFLIVTDKQEIERIGRIRYVWPYKTRGAAKLSAKEHNPAGIIGHAASLILVFADAAENYQFTTGEYYIWESLEIQNCAASIQNILLLATAKGLASCWVSASDRIAYSRLLSGRNWHDLLAPYQVPTSYKMQGVIVLGHPLTVDELDYPRGEKKHGSLVWRETARQSVEHYLIPTRERRDQHANATKPLGRAKRVQRRFCANLIRRLLRVVRRLDAIVTQIDLEEMRQDG